MLFEPASWSQYHLRKQVGYAVNRAECLTHPLTRVVRTSPRIIQCLCLNPGRKTNT